MISLRVATLHDLDALTAIEAASFPPAEGASRESFEARLKAFPEGFLIAEADGTPVGLIDGMVTNCETIEDRLYDDARLHDPQGAWQSVFIPTGVVGGLRAICSPPSSKRPEGRGGAA